MLWSQKYGVYQPFYESWMWREAHCGSTKGWPFLSMGSIQFEKYTRQINEWGPLEYEGIARPVPHKFCDKDLWLHKSRFFDECHENFHGQYRLLNCYHEIFMNIPPHPTFIKWQIYLIFLRQRLGATKKVFF